MPLHEELYAKLYKKLGRIIEELQTLQQECEEIYISFTPKEPILLNPKKEQVGKKGGPSESD